MTRVTRTSAWLVGACLAGALLTPPASAEGPADQISGLVGGLLGPGSPSPQPPPQRTAGSGHTSAPDGRLRKGCHNYRYRYAVASPTDDWTLETFLRGPRGGGVASGTYSSDSDPAVQRSHFRFCRWTTRPGRFTIRAKLTWYDRDGGGHVVWFQPSHFRLRRP